MNFEKGSDPLARSQMPTGWRARRRLPHVDQPGLVQMITFRLADALPASKMTELGADPEARNDPERRQQIEALLDAGYGACPLRDARLAGVVERALLHFDGERYHVFVWVVMPNHVHVLIGTRPDHPLPAIVRSWKSFAAKEANKLLGRTGPFWQEDYFDRAIRDDRHLGIAIRYIHDNPVKAGLVDDPADWPFSSAARTDWETKAGGTLALPG